jgi:DNA adenine methylase
MDWEKSDEFANIRPFLRWAGSKRLLLKHLVPFIPKSLNKYYEPFLGGGSMFFYIGPKSAEISDASLPLIETYRAVRKYSDEVLDFLRPLRPSKTRFLALRQYSPRSEVGRAAQFIFLNKACWNGLYRVNSDGIFNVPYGRPRTNFIIDEDNLRRCSRQLRRREVSIKNQDFEEIESRVKEGDFVFLDPPYVTSHNMNGFVDWNERLFSWSDQIRLAEMAKRIIKKKANVLITNAAHGDVQALYSGFGRVTFSRWSALASDTSRRGTTSEAIFFGGPAYSSKKAVPGSYGWKQRHGSERRIGGSG